MQCSMQLLFHRSGLPSLAQLYSRKQLLARPAHLTCSGYWCRACCSTRPVSLKATGQVISKEANFVTVRLNRSDDSLTATPVRTDLVCSVRALLKKIKQTVLVGDNVQVDSIDWAEKRGVVQEVFDRHSEVSDPAMANVDQIILVMSLNLPPFDARQATRFLVSAEAASIPVMQALVAEVQHWGYKAIAVSVATGQGMSQLADALDGRISAVAGPSGVGKSSIINALRLRAQHAQPGQGTQQAQQAQQAQAAGHAQKAQHTQHTLHDHIGGSNSNSNLNTASASSSQACEDTDADHSVKVDRVSEVMQATLSGTAHRTSDNGSDTASQAARTHPATASSSSAEQQYKNGLLPHASQQSGRDDESGAGPDPLAASSSSSSVVSGSHDGNGTSSISPSSSLSITRSMLTGQQEDAQPSGPWSEDEARQRGPVGVGEGVQLQSVGEMSNIGRGMHTTRHVALLEVGRGLLADTPGFNVPSLTNLTVSNLQACFPEIQRRLETYRCAFSNCQHLQEPGCCLHEGFDRHPIYVELYHEVKQNEDLERHRSMSKKRRQGTVRFKSRAGGAQTREALLETKTHRRVNRRHTRQGMQDLIDKASQEQADDL